MHASPRRLTRQVGEQRLVAGFLCGLSLLVLDGCGMESLQRSDKPLSRVEASKYLSFALPASAREVYFVTHAGGLQEFQEFVRFTVDAGEMDPTVEALLVRHTASGAVYSPEAEKPFQPMAWWAPACIAHGHHRTGNRSPIYIWTDTDNHVIFVFKSD